MRPAIYTVVFVLVSAVGETFPQQPVSGDMRPPSDNGCRTAPRDAPDPFGPVGETTPGDADPFAPSCEGDPEPTIQLTLVPSIERDEEAGTLIANLLLLNDTGADVLVHGDTFLLWTLRREVAPDAHPAELARWQA